MQQEVCVLGTALTANLVQQHNSDVSTSDLHCLNNRASYFFMFIEALGEIFLDQSFLLTFSA